jgi:hypothetical protein
MTYHSRSPLSVLVVTLCVAAFAVPVAAQTVSLNAGGEQVRIKVGDAAVLPADFPADIALPQPHVLTRVQRSAQQTMLELDTSGGLDAVATRFRAGMLANGWAPARVVQPAAGSAQAWEKEGRAVIAWLAAGTAGVHLQLQLLPRR